MQCLESCGNLGIKDLSRISVTTYKRARSCKENQEVRKKEWEYITIRGLRLEEESYSTLCGIVRSKPLLHYFGTRGGESSMERHLEVRLDRGECRAEFCSGRDILWTELAVRFWGHLIPLFSRRSSRHRSVTSRSPAIGGDLHPCCCSLHRQGLNIVFFAIRGVRHCSRYAILRCRACQVLARKTFSLI